MIQISHLYVTVTYDSSEVQDNVGTVTKPPHRLIEDEIRSNLESVPGIKHASVLTTQVLQQP